MEEIERLNNNNLAALALDYFRRTALHYGIWFSEVNHQLGLHEALQTEEEVFGKFMPIIYKRLTSALGYEKHSDLQAMLNSLPKEKLLALLDATATSWLAGDGLWFQTVEKRHEMFTSKRCNDTCWTRFSPLEAHSIKALLDLPDNGGLDALEKALGYRLYSRVNIQSTEREGASLIFKMVNCRVQFARERKGMEDYPCKSAGTVEYSTFACTIDPRIKTECISCPPDAHPVEWFCAWKFFIP